MLDIYLSRDSGQCKLGSSGRKSRGNDIVLKSHLVDALLLDYCLMNASYAQYSSVMINQCWQENNCHRYRRGPRFYDVGRLEVCSRIPFVEVLGVT